ncbi:MAG: hypothetical protein ACOZNI_31200 [Myxococcota bacterium]
MLLLALITQADAKDLRGRLGVGFHQALASTSAISLRYTLPGAQPTSTVQIEVDAGLDLTDTATDYYAGGRLLFGVVAEDNMGLYLGAGAGYLGGSGRVRVQPAVGAQFFFFGLENLGFSVEWGVNADFGTGYRVATFGTGPAAAVHYWF